ncbi:MAG: hypothetical protein Q4B22_04515 [Eubacteriales bacterium]|nr:hypothetical protein [Eubacteriales bacterium]
MKKRVITMLTVLSMAVSMTACGNKEENADASAAESSAVSTEAVPEVEATPEVTPTATPEATEVVIASTSETTPEAEKKEEPEAENAVAAVGLKTIGSENAGAKRINVTNKMGMGIKSISVLNDENAEANNLLAEGDVFAADEDRILYYEVAADTSAGDDNASEKMTVPSIIVKITTEDDMEYTLHGFPVEDASGVAITIDADNNIAYFTYKSKSSGEEVSTLETEIYGSAMNLNGYSEDTTDYTYSGEEYTGEYDASADQDTGYYDESYTYDEAEY